MEHVKQEDLVHIDLWAIVRRVFPALRQLWPLILALMVAFGSIMYLRAARAYTPMYQSEVMFSVSLNNTGETDISSYSYYYDNAAAKQLVETFPYILNTRLTREMICQELGMSYINGSITSRSMADTNCFVLTVTSSNAQDAYDILQAVIDVYPQVSRRIIGETQLLVSREPALATAPYNSFSWKTPVMRGMIAGAVLGLAIVVLLAAMRRTVLRPEDVKKLVNLSCLARIPAVQRKKRKSGNEAALLITQLESDSAFCEAHRLLRLKLLRQLKEEDKILMVTSSVPAEGKSTLSANLALLLSRDGKKVLLIDADLRGPSIKELLQITKSSTGLDAHLADPKLPVKFLRYGGQSKLYLLAGDEAISSPTPLLQHDVLHNFLQPLRDMFDYIIIDTPPCTMMADASALCVHADKVIYAVREDYATVGQISDGVQSLSDTGADICGFVFTRSSGSTSSGYGYGYGYGYSHYGKRYGYSKNKSSETSQ